MPCVDMLPNTEESPTATPPSVHQRRIILVADTIPFSLYQENCNPTSSGNLSRSSSTRLSTHRYPRRLSRGLTPAPEAISHSTSGSELLSSGCDYSRSSGSINYSNNGASEHHPLMMEISTIDGENEPTAAIKIEENKGHLLTALSQYLRPNEEVLMIGRPLVLEDGLASVRTSEIFSESKIKQALAGSQAIPVFTERAEQSLADTYKRALLWPLLHYVVWDFNSEWLHETATWKAFVRINELFSEQIVKNYEHGDIIWIFGYELLLVPALVRAKYPSAAISFYLRSPFPSSELFRCLPEAKELLQGSLGANIIGFQAYSYARHFLSSCTRLLGCESAGLTIDHNGVPVDLFVHAMGINVDEVISKSQQEAVKERFTAIKDVFKGRKVVLGIDTFDQSRGILHKLKALEKYFQMFPEDVGSFALVQIVYGPVMAASAPTDTLENTSTASLASLMNKLGDPRITEIVTSINNSCGSLDFYPVHLYQQALETEEYFALLKRADLFLLTSERDTANAIVLEYIASQGERHGLPIFSEFSALADQMPSSAMRVNPWDHRGTALMLRRALYLDEEQRRQEHAKLTKFLRNHSMEKFVDSLMDAITSSSVTCLNAYSPTPLLSFELIMECYEEADVRLILLDYDGTLTSISRVPSAAVPSNDLLRMLRMLTANSRNFVYVISGRDQATLEEWLGVVPRLGLSAEHGCYLRPISNADAGDSPKWISSICTEELYWKNDVAQIMEYYTERTPGSFIEYKNASLTWHYRLSDPEFGSWQAKSLQSHLEATITSNFPVEVITGKKNLEVRPRSCNKGEIIRNLLERHGKPQFVFCAGDDRTDEDMFRSLNDAFAPESPTVERCFTCCIGAPSRRTAAKYRVGSPEQMVALLMRLASFSAERSLGVTL